MVYWWAEQTLIQVPSLVLDIAPGPHYPFDVLQLIFSIMPGLAPTQTLVHQSPCSSQNVAFPDHLFGTYKILKAAWTQILCGILLLRKHFYQLKMRSAPREPMKRFRKTFGGVKPKWQTFILRLKSALSSNFFLYFSMTFSVFWSLSAACRSLGEKLEFIEGEKS